MSESRAFFPFFSFLLPFLRDAVFFLGGKGERKKQKARQEVLDQQEQQLKGFEADKECRYKVSVRVDSSMR